MNNDSAEKKQDKTKVVIKQTLDFAKKIGIATVALIKKLKKDRSPAAVIAEIDQKIAEIAIQKEKLSTEIESLHKTILSKKNEYQKTSKAKREILEGELQNLLTSYESAKRTYKILLENERQMTLVKGRIGEISAYGMKTVSESLIDKVIDDLDYAADEAEAITDAEKDLEKAGKRREREEDKQQLWDTLADFDEEEICSEEEPTEKHTKEIYTTKEGKNKQHNQPEKEE